MRTIKLTLAYDGSEFFGWQRQRGRRTVQETLERTIEKVTGRPVSVLASGRTDAGVHALGQVASFETESRLTAAVLERALNAELPRDMAVLEAVEVPAGFHATHQVVRKRYRYMIHDGPVRDVFQRRYAWHFTGGRLDEAAMQRAAQPLVGKHDFSSFQTAGAPRKTSVRTIFELGIERGRAGGEGGKMKDEGAEGWCSRGLVAAGEHPRAKNTETFLQVPAGQGRGGPEDFITIEIEADGFLYNMVRAIVGTLVEVGRGAQPESWPGEVLLAADRRLAGRTAPPQGLFLVRAEYGEPGAGSREHGAESREHGAGSGERGVKAGSGGRGEREP
jgi:tRNA pseudouridine38-40 synthase